MYDNFNETIRVSIFLFKFRFIAKFVSISKWKIYGHNLSSFHTHGSVKFESFYPNISVTMHFNIHFLNETLTQMIPNSKPQIKTLYSGSNSIESHEMM